MAKLQVGVNDLETLYPEISKEWHPEKNGELKPCNVHAGSSKSVWWLCPNGHSYEKTVAKRTIRNQNCPICRLEKYSFENIHPELLVFWDYDKNAPLLPSECFYGSDKNVWWKCEKGHSYQQRINRKSQGAGCPICTHQLVTKETCLATQYPELAKFGHPSKNGSLTPYDVMPHTHKKVWWLCANGHEYQKAIYSHHKTGCPVCDSEKRTSFPEQAILYYLDKIFPVEGRSNIGGFEADIFCPSLNVVIEYDGEYYHKGQASSNREDKKNHFFAKQNILLFRVKETKEEVNFSYHKTDYGYNLNVHYTQDYSFLTEVIATIIQLINEKFSSNYYIGNIDIVKDKVEIIKQYAIQKELNSFISQKPLGAKKWDYEKNGTIDLKMLPKTSKKKYWWKCPTCGNEWYGSLDNIVDSLTCNKCSRQVKTEYEVSPEVYINDTSRFRDLPNSLQTQNPELASEWHPTKNGIFKPSHVTPKSGKRVWWLCPHCGFEWIQIIKTRNNGVSARMCPRCANNQKVKKTSTFIFNSDLYAEWHPTKNETKNLADYSPGSNEKVWWLCKECGTEYTCSIKYRQTGRGCPKCGKKHSAEAKFKKVINLDTDEVFDSVKSAATKYGIKSHSSISQCLSGKNKTAGGYRWSYYD